MQDITSHELYNILNPVHLYTMGMRKGGDLSPEFAKKLLAAVTKMRMTRTSDKMYEGNINQIMTYMRSSLNALI